MTKLKKFLEHVLILTLSFSSTLAYSSKSGVYCLDSFSLNVLDVQSQRGISYVSPPIRTFQTGISLLGYYIDEDTRRFVTFWDYNSLNNSDKNEVLQIKEMVLTLNSQNGYYDWKYNSWWEAARNFISPFTGGCASYSSMYSKTGFMYYSLEISGQLYYCDTRYTSPTREYANEILKPDRETFDRIFGKSLNTTLRNNGQKINYFLTHTNNLENFAKDYAENKNVYIQVLDLEEGSDDFKQYLEGLNLFMRTIMKENKSASYDLEIAQPESKKSRLFKKSNQVEDPNYQRFKLIEK